MTTKVTVDAHAGWPVKVTCKHPKTGAIDWVQTVEPKTVKDFYVHSGADLEIHEVQPDEQQAGVQFKSEALCADDGELRPDPLNSRPATADWPVEQSAGLFFRGPRSRNNPLSAYSQS